MIRLTVSSPIRHSVVGEDSGSDYPAQYRTRETSDMFITLIIEKL